MSCLGCRNITTHRHALPLAENVASHPRELGRVKHWLMLCRNESSRALLTKKQDDRGRRNMAISALRPWSRLQVLDESDDQLWCEVRRGDATTGCKIKVCTAYVHYGIPHHKRHTISQGALGIWYCRPTHTITTPYTIRATEQPKVDVVDVHNNIQGFYLPATCPPGRTERPTSLASEQLSTLHPLGNSS